MSTYNVAVTFATTPAISLTTEESTFTQGFIMLVSIENEYMVTLTEVTGGMA